MGRRVEADETMSADDMIPTWVDGVLQPFEKLEAHRRGLRHKAVSVFVNCGHRTLLQRRALGKYHTPGLWANACCTHPHWGEDTADCAARRLGEELNLSGLRPRFAGHVHYRADVGGGLTEDEEVDIFIVELDHLIDVSPNPAEVMDTKWVATEDAAADVRAAATRYTPWLRIYFERHRDLFDRRSEG